MAFGRRAIELKKKKAEDEKKAEEIAKAEAEKKKAEEEAAKKRGDPDAAEKARKEADEAYQVAKDLRDLNKSLLDEIRGLRKVLE